MTELQELQALVRNDPACQKILIADIEREFPAGATAAIRSRLERAWQSTACLQYALRAAGFDEQGVTALIDSDRRSADKQEEDAAKRAETVARRRKLEVDGYDPRKVTEDDE
jgi:hypothetical protein